MASKPYHAGHDGLIRIAAKENDEVIVFVSVMDRARKGELTIRGSDMKQVWDDYIEPILPDNVSVVYCQSPVQLVYKELEDAEARRDRTTKFRIYSDTQDIVKYTSNSLTKSAPNLFSNNQIERRGVDRNETVNISGTKMRSFLEKGDVESFANYLPAWISRDAREIMNILTRNENRRSMRRSENIIRGNMSGKLLKEYVREVLTEDIVTVSRGSSSQTYDAVFDKTGNIRSAQKIDLSEQDVELMAVAEKLSHVPQGVVYEKLRSLRLKKVKLQADAVSPQNVTNVMNKYWTDTLRWPTASRIGRGELQLRLAFKTDPSVSEPDFVSADGVKLSVKYLGNGSSTAKTGEASTEIPSLTAEFAAALGISKFPQSSFSGANLIAQVENMDPKKKSAAIKKARQVLNKIKLTIVKEHDADGILMLDDRNGFYLVDQVNFKDVNPTSIRNSGTRVEFTGPKLSPGIMTLERALDRLEGSAGPEKEETPKVKKTIKKSV